MTYVKKYPNGFIDKWGNFHKVGRGDSSPVIGKSGPRPELRKLVYGVGINDVMIPYFTKTTIWKTWNGIIRRTDNRDPKWIEQSKKSYLDCTLDSRWYKLSAFKEWIEQWDDFENKEVDKDILIPGNKIYGPDTCLMVRPYCQLLGSNQTETEEIYLEEFVGTLLGKEVKVQIHIVLNYPHWG